MTTTNNPAQIQCPHQGCRRRYVVPGSSIGKVAKCAGCGGHFVADPCALAAPMSGLAATPPPKSAANTPPPRTSDTLATISAGNAEEVVVAAIAKALPPVLAKHDHGTLPAVPGKPEIACPHCARRVGIVSHLAWKQVICPFCGGQFEMPGDIRQLTWLDRQLCQSGGCSVALLILASNGLALVLGVVGLLVCKHPKAREHASNLTWGGAMLTCVGITFVVFRLLLSNPP